MSEMKSGASGLEAGCGGFRPRTTLGRLVETFGEFDEFNGNGMGEPDAVFGEVETVLVLMHESRVYSQDGWFSMS